MFLIAGGGHAGNDWGKDGIERLIDFTQAARKLDRGTVNANCCQSYSGSAADEPSQHADQR